METIQITNNEGAFVGTMSIDCKIQNKVTKPYFDNDGALIVPSGWSGARVNKYLKSSEGKKAKLATVQGANEETAAKEAILAKLVGNLETNDSFENTYTETHLFVWVSGRYETRYLAKGNRYTIRSGAINLTSKERGLIASQITKHLVFCL